MIFSGNLGYPRIGKKRELKFALEKYWKREIGIDELRNTAQDIRTRNWHTHQKLGFDYIPCGDFSLYDHVLDHAIMFNAIPSRFLNLPSNNPEDLIFRMARGFQLNGKAVAPMEMTKWFNTNYHYIVPEIDAHTAFLLNDKKLHSEIVEARSLDIKIRPIVIGPVSFLLLSKTTQTRFFPLTRLDDLLPVYEQLFNNLRQAGVQWIQVDEPFLGTDLNSDEENAYRIFFNSFQESASRPKVLLTAYFADLSLNAPLLQSSPFKGLHLDLTQLSNYEKVIKITSQIESYSLGIINGRNIWQEDLKKKINQIHKISKLTAPRDLVISPSCSMLHLPLDVHMETELDSSVRSWLSFAEQKLENIALLKTVMENEPSVEGYLKKNQNTIRERKSSGKVNLIKELPDFDSLPDEVVSRNTPFCERKLAQQKCLNLPLLPTTTIGSFPQTKEVRKARAQYKRGEIGVDAYRSFLKKEIARTIDFQEKIGMDVLVHGEFERNDMVQYFAEKLSGFTFTKHGWVQSYGSRCVRPPIIYGDVTRPDPMTVEWIRYAQSLTNKFVKGMLTGPVTILQWSFVRDDKPRSETCKQIAFAIRDEVLDLEKAGTKIIQIDEPALREGLPIQRSGWKEYLDWAVKCFRIASAGVRDETQIHTHMCYAEFNDIIDAIIEMDADVISVEASRSKMELLNAFGKVTYPNEIGPGIYDIHSPNIPGEAEMVQLIKKALAVIPADRLWINPDCGLKTRTWEEVDPSLINMVTSAQIIRKEISEHGKNE